MALYRITVITATGRLSFPGLFATSCEAVEQTMADWPEAKSIKAKLIKKASQ
ncbi:hypothetical protein ACDW_22910 [Acidovorax sp. DW039]|uniref:hypothetical protein n=1 Tax=Acidovorax sp. DW039 TaxID=3095606 RepID=UPI00308CB732|nr:hypothetical protein ACDW_22910 [Acidovorax sp. DW039]